MEALNKIFRPISLVGGLCMGITLPVLFVYLKSKGLSNIEIALVTVCASVSTVIFDLPTGVLADKVGRRKMYLMGQFVYLIFCLGITFAASFEHLALLMALAGLSSALVSGTLDVIYVEMYNKSSTETDDSLQKQLAILGQYSVLGTLAGALLGVFTGLGISALGFDSLIVVQNNVFVIVGFITSLLSFYVLAKVPEDADRTSSIRDLSFEGISRQFRDAIKAFTSSQHLLILLFSGAIAAAGYMSFEKFWQLFVNELSGEPISNAIFYSFFCAGLVASGIGQNLSVKLCQAMNNNLLNALLVTRIGLICAFIMLSISSNIPMFLCAFLFVFLISSMSASPSMALFHEYVEDDKRSSLLSLRSVFIQLGAAIGILGAGFVAHQHSISITFVASVLIYLMSTLLLISNRKIWQKSAQI